MMIKRIDIAHLIVSLILILFLTLSTGCELISGKNTTLPSEQPQTTTNNTTPIDTEWSIPLAKSQSPILPSIADVVAKVKPSVVIITTKVVARDFFNRLSTQDGPIASGWILRKDGIIVTNNHVVEQAESVTVILDDGRTFSVDMKTVATDPLTDLAILKIDAENLTAAAIGDSSALRVGDWVVAIGNALGEGTSATTGIVSALGVSLSESPGQTILDLIQTDASINPGNSGGPLVNTSGEVIGITSVKVAQVGVEGMGYAISSNEALPIIQQLITSGYVVRPWLGVTLYTVDQFVILRYNLTVEKGALIVDVAAGSPADEAGLKPGDVIVSMDGKEITNTQELIRGIDVAQMGQKTEIIFWRGEDKKTTYATLIEKPPPA